MSPTVTTSEVDAGMQMTQGKGGHTMRIDGRPGFVAGEEMSAGESVGMCDGCLRRSYANNGPAETPIIGEIHTEPGSCGQSEENGDWNVIGGGG